MEPTDRREARRLIRRWRVRVGGAAVFALSACGPRDAQYPLEPVGPNVAITTTSPLFAGASYVALVGPPDRSESGPQVLMETDGRSCMEALERWEGRAQERQRLHDTIRAMDEALTRSDDAQERAALEDERRGLQAQLESMSEDDRCPDAVREALLHLGGGRHLVLLEGGEVRVISSMDALAPIESAEEAVLGLWLAARNVSIWDAQVHAVDGGFEVTASASETELLDDDPVDRCEIPSLTRYYREVIFVGADGSSRTVDRQLSSQAIGSEDQCHTYGRRTDGAPVRCAPTRLVDFFQRAADEEAEAVLAFERLAGELRHHRAPRALVEGALDAADDERRHVAMVIALGASLGFELDARVPHRELPTRDLEAVLLENAVEGRVHETYAAAVAMHQAKHAAHPGVRRHFRRVAADEVGHAALAHAIHEALSPRLSAAARARVEAAQQAARGQLRSATDRVPAALRDLGLPGPDFRAAFFSRL